MDDVRTPDSQEPPDPAMAPKTATLKVNYNNAVSNMRQPQPLITIATPRSVH